MKTLIRNAYLVNEGKIQVSNVLIHNERIEKIDPTIDSLKNSAYKEINAEGLYLIPGVIDDQVHFREPGLTHKGTILSESKAAVAGGVTSFMDMPNTVPNTLTIDLLENKYQAAAHTSLANYSFFMGICQTNLKEALKINNETVCGITDDGLYFNNDKGILANYPEFLEKLFAQSNSLIALHSEDDHIIGNNLNHFKDHYGENIPMDCHPKIRSEEACLTATKRVLEIAKKHNTRLHFFHISTLAEANLFDNHLPAKAKRITAEACVHHLWFSDKDYKKLGAKIKWNPAIKTEVDKLGLMTALLENKLDIIATDHAPHSFQEKNGNYFQALSGGPLVQHSLVLMLELVHQKVISIEKVVEKMCHNVADIYTIQERGYIREGYYADLVLIDLNHPWKVSPENILYKCQWSPLENQTLNSKVVTTFVNGQMVYNYGIVLSNKKGQRLKFSKYR